MKLVSFKRKEALTDPWRAGFISGDGIVDIAVAVEGAPATLQGLLEDWSKWGPRLQEAAAEEGKYAALAYDMVKLGSPLPRPLSFRDFYAFEAHVKTARGRRGLEMVPEWYDFPVFYFSNAAAFLGHEDTLVRPKATQWLDYELEIACVIAREGRDIPLEEADSYIAGFCILNDWSARDIQREEVKVGLGPAKGKDFATSMGPFMLTVDELAEVCTRTEKGNRYNLTMTARVNGEEYSRGNLIDIHYTFAELIARASADCTLYPGDVIGSGTVGTGCILELGPENRPWLLPGDTVECEIDRLGVLRNTIADQ
ncbi:fumarylacetoacetate hydrolase family protein [Brevibacillus dissolubilis]|uniref:fumarylacetoacetate hydrolase family protein n=1 Tax=Brevibacillus dissolubilis TaxID=1844116 RepID=UPI001117AC78|nr:fumarylacetoacetate hydrolase family protein [Brevibacillus dissolubilis]